MLYQEGHEAHEGSGGFTTNLFPQRRRDAEDDDSLVENTQGVEVLPSCLSTAKQPLSHRDTEVPEQPPSDHEVHEGKQDLTIPLWESTIARPQGRMRIDSGERPTIQRSPKLLSGAKEPLPGRGAETLRTPSNSTLVDCNIWIVFALESEAC